MKRMMAVAFVLVGALAGLASAKGGAAAFSAAADLKWVDVPGFAGLQMAPVDGDPAKGPSHFFMKFPGGFAAPDHHHSADHFVSVVSGTMNLTVDGKENKMGAGSFFSFKGKKVHATKCEAGADCVIFVDSRGKWDVVPEKGAAAPAADVKAPPPVK